jgi:hypothetical protein
MARKRNSENDLVVSSSAAAAPVRHKPAAKPRLQRAAPQIETPAATSELPASPALADAAYMPSRAEIADLAYSYWEARGYQGGSPAEDWLRAEQELRERIAVTVG